MRRSPRLLLVLGLLLALAAAGGTPSAASTKSQLKKALKQSRAAQAQAEQALQVAMQALAASGAPSTLPDGSVTTPKIANGAVTAPKLGPGAVTAPALAPGAVTAGTIGSQAIDSSSLFTTGVLDSQLLFGQDVIGPDAIVPGAVGTAAFGTIPSARVTFSPAQMIPDEDTTYTTVAWNQEVFDTQGLHTGSSPNLTAPVDGVYQVSLSVEINNAAIAGITDMAFFALIQDQAGNTLAQTQNVTTDTSNVSWNPIDLNLSTLIDLDVGESVQAQVLQWSGGGGSLPLDPGDSASSFAMAWVGPQS